MYTDASERHELAHAREALVRQLVAAQERERARIARELHDQMGQHIVALSLGLARLSSEIGGHAGACAVVDQLRKVADLLGRDVHTLAMELRPSALDHLGLAVALTSYAEEVASRSELQIDVHCDPIADLQLSGAAANRALSNCTGSAHQRRETCARAARSALSLKGVALFSSSSLRMTGIGFSTVQLRNADGKSEKLGLAGMQRTRGPPRRHRYNRILARQRNDASTRAFRSRRREGVEYEQETSTAAR